MFPMKDTCCNAHQENDLFGTSFTWERKLWEYFGIVYVFSLNNCMFWTPWNAIKHTKAYKNICVLGLNLINIILFMKTNAYYVVVVVVVAFFKKSSDALNMRPCISLSWISVFSLYFICCLLAPQFVKKISTVCKIRCLCTQKGEKSCIICYKKSLWKKNVSGENFQHLYEVKIWICVFFDTSKVFWSCTFWNSFVMWSC